VNDLTPIRVRRVEIDEARLRVNTSQPGLYLHRDDVIAVILGYANQLDEYGKLGDNDHLVGVDGVMADIRHSVSWFAARELVKLADYFRDIRE
jgi:hypothetical protein